MTKRIRAYLVLMSDTVGTAAVARLLLLQLLIALMEGAGLALLAPILQSLGGSEVLEVPGTGLSLSVTGAFSLVLAVVLIRALGQWRVAVLSVDIRLATIDALRLRLLEDLYAADWSYLAGQRRSFIVQRLTTEVERAHNALFSMIRIIVGFLILLATVIVAIVLSPIIGGTASVVVVLVTAVARRSIRNAVELGQTMNERTESFGAAITDSLASVRLMRAHNASAAWTKLVSEEARHMREVRRTFVRKTAAVVAALSIGVVLAVLVLILAGREAGMSYFELAALAVIASRLMAAGQGLLGSAQVFSNDAPALDRLNEFGEEVRRHREDDPPQIGEVPTLAAAPLVSLSDVSVSYPASPNAVLTRVSLDIPRGGMVTLSGTAGSEERARCSMWRWACFALLPAPFWSMARR